MERRIYFDWAATAPPLPPPETEAPFGNPSSKHLEGRKAREALEKARERCAAVLGVSPGTLYFSSGGTESNALVLHSLLLRRSRGETMLLYSAVEHPSVRENAAVLGRLGKAAAPIGVENDGRVSRRTLGKALDKHGLPRLVAIMAVNNETGAMADLPDLAAELRSREGPPVHIHSDMVQAVGKVPVDLAYWDLDSAGLSAHKLGGPRGIGLLYLKKPLDPLYTGGGQERGIRPGTENTAGALALAACLERRAQRETVEADFAAAAERWQVLITALRSLDRCSILPGDRGERDLRFSPYILQAAFSGIPGEVMVRALDDAGFAVSTGSACSTASASRPVLAAMGVAEHTALEGVRFSQGWTTTMDDIEQLARAIRSILQTL
jgi:cysteine desulfurase